MKQNTIFLWIAAISGVILLIPFVAMQFSREVVWALGDFVIMGLMLFGAGSGFVLVARQLNKKYWVITGVVIGLAFLYLWAELAVGIFTNWGS